MHAFFFFFPWPYHSACEILVPLPGVKPASPALAAWSLNHRTAREVLTCMFWFNLQTYSVISPGLPWWLSSKEPPAKAGDAGSIPGLGRSPEWRNGQLTPVLLSGKFHGQRTLAGYSPWCCKESDTTEWLKSNNKSPFYTVGLGGLPRGRYSVSQSPIWIWLILKSILFISHWRILSSWTLKTAALSYGAEIICSLLIKGDESIPEVASTE